MRDRLMPEGTSSESEEGFVDSILHDERYFNKQEEEV